MEVAQHPGLGIGGVLQQQGAPQLQKFLVVRRRQRGAAVGQIPFRHQADLDQHRFDVEFRDGVVRSARHRQHGGQRLAMQRRQAIGGGLVAFSDRLARHAAEEAGAAEILGDQKAIAQIGVQDRRRGKAALAQAMGDRDKRPDVFGEVHRGAVGAAAIDRWAIGPARRVHQDQRRAVMKQPGIRAGRGIAGDPFARCLHLASPFQERAQRLQPLHLGGGLAITFDLGGAGHRA